MASSARVRALVFHDSQILLMKRWRNGNQFFVFVGGGIDKNESSEQAVTREVYEETSLRVVPERVVYVHSDSYGVQDVWLCRLVGDPSSPHLQENTSEFADSKHGLNRYEPCWLPLSMLKKVDLKPHSIRDRLLVDRDKDWPTVELTH